MFLRILRYDPGDRPAVARTAGTGRSAALATLLALFTGAFFCDALIAGSASAPMGVSVYVVPRAVLFVESSPSAVIVTAADVARGYIDLNDGIVLRVRTNSRAGYLLQARRTDQHFAAIELSFAGGSLNVSEEAWIQRPYVAGGEWLTLRARLRLAPGTVAGTYPLPAVFSASPL